MIHRHLDQGVFRWWSFLTTLSTILVGIDLDNVVELLRLPATLAHLAHQDRRATDERLEKCLSSPYRSRVAAHPNSTSAFWHIWLDGRCWSAVSRYLSCSSGVVAQVDGARSNLSYQLALVSTSGWWPVATVEQGVRNWKSNQGHEDRFRGIEFIAWLGCRRQL